MLDSACVCESMSGYVNFKRLILRIRTRVLFVVYHFIFYR